MARDRISLNQARGKRGWRLLAAVVALGLTVPTARAGTAPNPAQLLAQLEHVRMDASQIYALRHVRIERVGMSIYFTRGFIAFFQKVSGEVTGAMFAGQGEILVMPPTEVERQSLATFTGSPVLDEEFSSAYLRFTDRTAEELLAQARRPDPNDPEQPGDFVGSWGPVVAELGQRNALRLLEDLIGGRSRPFFSMVVQGGSLGTFEVTDDERAVEAIQVRAVQASGERLFNDVWCEFPSRASRRDAEALRLGSASPLHFRIETRLNTDHSLDSRATIELESHSGSDRLLLFQISRMLEVSQVTDEKGQPVEFFETPEASSLGPASQEDRSVAVALPAPHAAGEKFTLTFTYHGDVIADVGNGVLFVGARGSWYPNLGPTTRASYDLTFRHPAGLTLVATGTRVEVQSADGWTTCRWVSDGPFAVAGFNVGAYHQRTVRAGSIDIQVSANEEAEAALQREYLKRLENRKGRRAKSSSDALESAPLAPAALLDLLSARAARIVAFDERLFGPFPFPHLEIAEIPGRFGQGWPELIYLPTLSYLQPPAQARLGFAELEAQTVLPHEIAHQWWGNLVGWKTYHDQWLSEGIATYAAALFLAEENGGDASSLHELLAGYKRDLLRKTAAGTTVESGGPIWLGARLSNSLNPNGYEQIVYKKACWVLQMLRMLMRDPRTGSDDRFFNMLSGFAAAYRGKDPSTEDFAAWASRSITPALDLDHNHSLEWFFKEWVYGTAIPTYRLKARISSGANGFVVRGTIGERGVPADFEMLVPLVAVDAANRRVRLGLVEVGPDPGKFEFTLPSKPERVEIDEDNILAIVRASLDSNR